MAGAQRARGAVVEGAVRRTDVHRHYRHPQSVLRRSQLHLLVCVFPKEPDDLLKFLQLGCRRRVFHVADIRQIFAKQGLSIRRARRVLREKIVQLGAQEGGMLSDHPP